MAANSSIEIHQHTHTDSLCGMVSNHGSFQLKITKKFIISLQGDPIN